MNTRIFKSVLAVMAAGLFLTSCEEEALNPSFPEKIEIPSVEKETESITFEVDMDWELSLPTETIAYFWIEDPDKGRTFRISGKPGRHTVKIGINTMVNLDSDVICPVTMHMGGKEQIVAEYTLTKSELTFEVYQCNVDALGHYLFLEGEEGGLDYPETGTDKVSIAYHMTTGFSIPVQFHAGFNYEIIEQPEWLELVLSSTSPVVVGRRGVCQVVMKVNPEQELPVSEALAGQIKIAERGTEDVFKTIEVEFAPVNDFLSWEGASEILFDGEGKYPGIDETVTSYVGTMYSSKGVVLFAAANFRKPQLGGTFWTGSEVDWVTITDSAWDESGKVLQRHDVTIEMGLNPGEERTADIYAIPASLANKLSNGYPFDATTHPLNSTYDDVKNEIKPYKIATLVQEFGGKKISLVSPASGVEFYEVEKDKYNPDSEQMDMRYSAVLQYSIQEVNKGLYHAVTSSEISVSVAGTVGKMVSLRYKPAVAEGAEGSFEVDAALFNVKEENGNYRISVNSDTAVEGALIFQTDQLIPIAALWIEYTPAE